MCAEDHVRAFAMRLRSLRHQARLTQAGLAELANISCVYVNKLERGLAAPSLQVLHRLAKCLGADVADLLSARTNESPPPDRCQQTSPYMALYLAGANISARHLVFETTDEPIPVPAPPQPKKCR